MVKSLKRKANEKGDDDDDDDDDDEKKFMQKKPKTEKGYKKHELLRLIVETAMEKEKMDIHIDTDDPIHKKIMKKVYVWRNGSEPILVDPLQSKKPPLIEKEAQFKEVVDVEEGKVVLVSKDVNDGDYEKEVMNKKTTKKASGKKSNSKRKNTCKLPLEQPNEGICKLMLKRIDEIQGLEPIWLSSKIFTNSDQDSGLGRFYIPKCVDLVKYLREDELDIIEGGLHCNVVDQNGGRWDLLFKYYTYLHQYAFVGGWKNLLKGFGLLRASKNAPNEDVSEVPGGRIDMWCFRLPDFSLSFGLRITRL